MLMKVVKNVKSICLALLFTNILIVNGGEISPIELARKLNEAFIEVADKVSPSVVVIKVARKSGVIFEFDTYEFHFWDFIPKEFRRRFFGEPEQPQRPRRLPRFTSQGSGIIIREDGYILTNSHVVEDAEKIRIRLKDGREYDAEIRGVDTKSDIAVLKIKDPDVKGLKPAKLGDSSKVRVGEFAIAIGAPYDLEYTVTIGHVSAKGRSQIIPDPSMDQDFIQTDASINPGNSGGPLVNINGEVIGINTLIRGLRTGIGFAIPINLAKEVANKLIEEGKYTRAWLGISIVSLSEDPDYRALVKGVDEGVVVRAIHPEGPASKSELKPADIITSVDGKPVATAQQLKEEIRKKNIGQTITLDIVRNGKPMKIRVKTAEMPDESLNSTLPSPSKKGEDSEPQRLGLTIQTLTRDVADKYGVDFTPGVIITEVEPNSPADSKGLKVGDIITDVNHKPVTSAREFKDALKSADLKKGVILTIISNNVKQFVIIKTDSD